MTDYVEAPEWSQLAEFDHPHRQEWAAGWQYACVWRFQHCPTPADAAKWRAGGPPHLFEPPAGDGWERNADQVGGGFWVAPPSWCTDGSVLMQHVYWRRRSPGMQPWHVRAHLHEERD